METDPTDYGGKTDRALLRAHILMMASTAGVAGGRYSALDREAVKWLIETRDELLRTLQRVTACYDDLAETYADFVEHGYVVDEEGTVISAAHEVATARAAIAKAEE